MASRASKIMARYERIARRPLMPYERRAVEDTLDYQVACLKDELESLGNQLQEAAVDLLRKLRLA